MSNEMKNLTIGSTTWEVVDSTARSDISNLSSRIDNLPEPMVFRGSLGTGGTITSLPVDGSASIGDTYKVITDGIYASQSAKVGDTFICDSETSGANTWVLIPSGDEPSGTVTSITLQATSPIVVDSSSAITTSGTRTISHADSGVTAGTYTSVTVDAKGHVTAGSNPPQPAATTFYDNTSSELSATNVQDALDEVVDDLDDKADRVPLPADYDSSSTYAVGDFVTYNDNIYICISAISTAEAWNSAHWQLVDADDSYLHSLNPKGSGSFSLNRKTNTTIGFCSFAEGYNTTASGDRAHAEGSNTTASGSASHAEGTSTYASNYSHAEGWNTTASGHVSHAEGENTMANSRGAHSEGYFAQASGNFSHAEGFFTIAQRKSQHVFGEYNIEDTTAGTASFRGAYVEIVGNGTAADARSNARTLDWSGNEVLAGSLTATQINGTLPYDNTSSGLTATNMQDAIDEVYGTFGTLDSVITGSPSASKTLTAFSETDGIVTATFSDISITKSQISDFPAYAGSSTEGGSATSAVRLDTSTAGSATQPCYFDNGVPVACTYSLNKTVPSDAVFTDTTYTSKAAASGGTDVSLCTTGEKYKWNNSPRMTTNSYPTLFDQDGNNSWIRIGTNNAYGLLPPNSGGAGSGHGNLGASGWYWNNIYVDNVNSASVLNRAALVPSTTTYSANDMRGQTRFLYSVHGVPYTGTTVSFDSSNTTNYPFQLNAKYNAAAGEARYSFRTRQGDTGTWSNWLECCPVYKYPNRLESNSTETLYVPYELRSSTKADVYLLVCANNYGNSGVYLLCPSTVSAHQILITNIKAASYLTVAAISDDYGFKLTATSAAFQRTIVRLS